MLNVKKMRYFYEAKTTKGKIKKGFIEAGNKKEVISRLKDEKLIPVLIKLDFKALLEAINIFRFGYVSYLSKLMFTKHLAVMIKSGIPLNESITILIEQAASGALRRVLKKILSYIEQGQNLADSMARFPRIFSELYVNIIRAGEKGGTLEENLNNLSIQLEKEFELRSKIKAAMFYPILVLSATVIIGLSLTIFVLPKITRLFVTFDVDLPLLTRILIFVTEFLSRYGVFVFILLIALVIGLTWLLRIKPIKPFTHRFLLRAPFTGRIAQDKNLALFSRTLGTLLRSGLPIIEALQITVRTSNNVAYRSVIEEVSREIQKGTNLSIVLRDYPNYFPPVVYRMVGVGERSGNLEGVLIYLAEFYEGEVEVATKNLSTVVEPILLLVIGFFVGAVGLAIITPIYKILSGIGPGG